MAEYCPKGKIDGSVKMLYQKCESITFRLNVCDIERLEQAFKSIIEFSNMGFELLQVSGYGGDKCMVDIVMTKQKTFRDYRIRASGEIGEWK